jgi:hypothetical protein
MIRVRERLDSDLSPEAREDAEAFLSRMLPLALHVLQIKRAPCPFCEAIGWAGEYHFRPNLGEDANGDCVKPAELESFLRQGLQSCIFRSVAMVQFIPHPERAITSMSVDLYLRDEASVLISVPIRTAPDLRIGKPTIVLLPNKPLD